MAAMPKPTLVRCECGQVIARIVGKSVRALVAEFTFRDNRAIIICPVCGARHRVGSGSVEQEEAA